MKGVIRFCKNEKLSPQYIGPYRISKRIGNVPYELELPQELAAVHLVFYISVLKKCMGDPSLIIPTEDTGIKDSLSYEEIPVQILDRQVRKLRTKEVASVKVMWRNQFVEEPTWEGPHFVIGSSGYGTVYKGDIDGGETTVAVKRSKPGSIQGENEF
ncbi:hypothetical protein MTR67_007490 [Solanum verrucosum]|uniref:Tf2-1-like SH3-like domain-containing protein n=1 Tax=Solanum verrucosum TaxID=315347 RepID=A0AAF0Q237_SOLVR|nr:hypothetical protein MTR67_007490 [Solanum verrucosum]